EAVNEEMDDSLERAATTATSLDAEQDRGKISKTQSKATPNETGSQGSSSGGGPRYQEVIGDTVAQTSLKLTELMELRTKLQQRVLDLKTTKTTQAMKIESLKVFIICEDPSVFTEADDHPALNEPDQTELADYFKPVEPQNNVIIEPISDDQPSPTIPPSALEEEGWIIAMQEELYQFKRNKMDVKSAFLNGKISEEAYVQQPPRLESSEYSNHVCKLDKAFYRLKQAPIAWYQANPKESYLVVLKRFFRKSTSGCCQILRENLVCWSAKKQSSVAMSSTKAELLRRNYVSNDLTLVKPHTITVVSFQTPLASEVPLTLHMLKVAKIFEEPKLSLIPPSREVNADDTADKSLSRAFMQPVTQFKTPTDLKTKKKIIPPSSKPKSPYKNRAIPSKKQVTETQYADVIVATANTTKSLVASELVEEQGNQPSAANSEKVLDQNVEEKGKDVGFVAIEESSLFDEDKDAKEGDAYDSLSGLRSMPDGDLAFMTGFETQDSVDHVSKEGTKTLHASADKPAQSNPLGHLHEELCDYYTTRKVRIFKSWRLANIYLFFNLSIKKSTLDIHLLGVGAAPLMSPRQDETSEPLLYARRMAGPYRCKDATRGQNDDPMTSGIKARLDRGGPKQNRSSCSP
nr:retrovirus-related Pol polyprotein from transposon TNT 1-94 [Tanacetum cinerariifolium]